jgi:hypothetical protein
MGLGVFQLVYLKTYFKQKKIVLLVRVRETPTVQWREGVYFSPHHRLCLSPESLHMSH